MSPDLEAASNPLGLRFSPKFEGRGRFTVCWCNGSLFKTEAEGRDMTIGSNLLRFILFLIAALASVFMSRAGPD